MMLFQGGEKMEKLTDRQRMMLVFDHKAPDRVPIIDEPWDGTISRWKREGMPGNTDYRDFFGIDKKFSLGVDNSPRYEVKTISDDGVSRIYTTQWGTTEKKLVGEDTTPQYLERRITSSTAWQEAKARMLPTPDRINWKWLEKEYPRAVEEDRWKQMSLWFGFDVAHSGMVGLENVLIAMIEEPEWCVDMFNTYLDVCIGLFEQVLDAGYKFDCGFWWDDMGYKQNQFFSMKMYRELLKPVHQRAVDWIHSKGMKAELHSCGDVRPFIPEFIEMGIDALNPIEVKAGMEPVEIKEKYGKDIVLHGGINALLWNDPVKMEAELDRLLPILSRDGGYIFATDHSIPNVVSLEQFGRVVDKVKTLTAN